MLLIAVSESPAEENLAKEKPLGVHCRCSPASFNRLGCGAVLLVQELLSGPEVAHEGLCGMDTRLDQAIRGATAGDRRPNKKSPAVRGFLIPAWAG
jgi:hypothetical protein